MNAVQPLPQSDTDISPFETLEFHQCWWEHLAPKFPITDRYQDLLVVKKKMLKGLLSLREMRIAGWNSAYDQDFTDIRCQDFLKFSTQAEWDYFRMDFKSNRESQQAFQQLKENGFELIALPAPTQYIADLTGGVDEYLSQLGRNTRQETRRKLRKAQPLNPHLVFYQTESEIDQFFELFFQAHIAHWDQKAGYSYFNDPQERAFMMAWAKALHRQGHVIFDAAFMGNEAVNFSIRLVYGNWTYGILTVNTGAYSEYFPGIVTLFLHFQDAFTRGIRFYNMGPGDYFYKVHTANKHISTHSMMVINPRSLRGRAYGVWHKKRQKNQLES
jgi:hypothetical protein